jgi:hypothetical protein
LKTSDVKASVGSNPTPSASNRNHLAMSAPHPKARGANACYGWEADIMRQHVQPESAVEI